MVSLCLTGLSRSVSSVFRHNTIKSTLELHPAIQTVIPSRNTFILKRKYPIKLNKIGFEDRRLKAKDYIYELIEDSETKKKSDVTVILKQYVEGLGEKGDCVTVKRIFAYNHLLVPGLADYATPGAIEEAKRKQMERGDKAHSSLTAPLTQKYLENMILSVLMNKDVEWTVEPWHVRVAFRKAGVHVPEDCITLPVKPINGPNLDYENKLFCITVTINNKEKATVRCLLHHFTPNPSERLPYVKYPWMLPLECIFPEDEEIIKKLPVVTFKKSPTDT